MTLRLVRMEYRDDGIFSELKDEKGKVLAQCVERSYNKKPKIKLGVYRCVRGLHKLRAAGPAFETFEVTGVKGHWGILFHVGNWHTDSDGCILVGGGIAHSAKGQMVTGSRVAFKEFMETLSGIETFTLEVRE